MNYNFPFTAVVGMDLVKRSLIYHAVDPLLGGLLLMGHRGCAKSTLARAFGEILPAPKKIEKIPFVEVPIGTTEDRLLGSIDASRLLKNGEWSPQVGLIQQANGGVLYIDEVNLLQDHLVDSILDSASSGRHRIERDGLSETVNARYILIGSMNPEEGDLRPQLNDRFTHGISVRDDFSVDQRKEIVRLRLDFEDHPESFLAEHKKKQDNLKKKILEVRQKLKNVKISENLCKEVAERAVVLKLEGVRAELGVIRTSRCAAAWRGETKVSQEDLEEAWILCLGHRQDHSATKFSKSKPDIKPPDSQKEKSHQNNSQMPKSSMSPINVREKEVILNPNQKKINAELLAWSKVSGKKQKTFSINFGTSDSISENIQHARICWNSSLCASILKGWIPGKPWSLCFRKHVRRNNFWLFLDSSRSTGAINFLSGARNAVQSLGSGFFRSRFYVLVLQKGELRWWVKRGTVQAFRNSLDQLSEASGGSHLSLAMNKLYTAVKKQGVLRGDRLLLCSDGMFTPEKERSIFESKIRLRKTLRRLSEKICNLAWLHPQLPRGMRRWLPDLVEGTEFRLIELDQNGSKYK